MLKKVILISCICDLIIGLAFTPCWAQLNQDTIPKPPTDQNSTNERYVPSTNSTNTTKDIKQDSSKSHITKPFATVRPVQLVISNNSLFSTTGGAGSYTNLLKEAQRLNTLLNSQLISERTWQIKISRYQLPVSLFDPKLRDAAQLLAPIAYEKSQLNIVNDATFQPTQSTIPDLLKDYVRYATTLEGQMLPTAHIQSNEIRQGIAEQHHTLCVAIQTKFIELRLGRCVFLEYNQRVSPNLSSQYSDIFLARGVGDYLGWQDLKSNYEDVYYKLKSLVQVTKDYPAPKSTDVEAARTRIRNWKSKFSSGIGSITDMQDAFKDLLIIEQAVLNIAQSNFNNLGIEGWSEINLIKDKVVPLIDKAINNENWF